MVLLKVEAALGATLSLSQPGVTSPIPSTSSTWEGVKLELLGPGEPLG